VVDPFALPMMCAGVGAAIQITTPAGTPYFVYSGVNATSSSAGDWKAFVPVPSRHRM